jgi:hypothetical protein
MLIAFAPWVLYLYGLQGLPSDSSPASDFVPPVMSQALWLSETGTTVMTMEPVSVWDCVWTLLRGQPEASPPSFRMAYLAARVLISRNSASKNQRPITHHLQQAAITIWISQRWTAEDATRTIFAGMYFGHGFYSLSQASQGYFGLPVHELSSREAAIIAGLVRSPSRYDPWCRPDKSRAFAETLMGRLVPGNNFVEKLRPAPAGACKEQAVE